MSWWSANNLRLIQNNLREIDAVMDVDLLIEELQQFNANVLMMNAGGIFAFYPSSLKHQYVTPYLKGDLLREAMDKAHEKGMRFIARFDFSKAHESLFSEHPEWFYRNRAGQEVNYFGIVHTCLNGEYQQQKSLESIEEVLSNYEVDGIFFNMFGYQNWDYSGNHYGPCYCGNCRRRFYEMTGEDLLQYSGPEHPLHAVYRSFQEQTAREILEKIYQFVKSRWPNVAISTYHPHKVDIVRKESNTALTRQGPSWPYSASENVASIENSWEGKLVSNCSINAIDLTYRFTGVSEEENAIRLYQNIANGSGLDFCIIGAFEGYPDRANFAAVKDIFKFHAEHEQIFGKLTSLSDVVLVKPLAPESGPEYYGLFKMLKESHILFDVVVEEQIPAMKHKLLGAQAILLPGLQNPSPDVAQTLSSLQQAQIPLLATGISVKHNASLLSAWFAAEYNGSMVNTLAAYFDVSNTGHFPSMGERSWVIASGDFARMNFDLTETECRMPYIEASTFGPPERAYGHQPGANYGLAIARRSGISIGAYFPWSPGALYYQHGFEDHKHVVMDVLLELMRGQAAVTNAPASTELFLHRLEDGSCLLQLLNLSGYNGSTYMKPIPIHDIRVELQANRLAQLPLGTLPIPDQLLAHSLCSGTELQLENKGESVIVTLPRLERYEAIVLRSAPSNMRKEDRSS